jgi:DNA-binding CsgD family transcriptional regulator
MTPYKDLPWDHIHDFLLCSGNIHDPKRYCEHIIRSLYSLIPYDQARLLYMDGSGHLKDVTLLGVEQWWWEAYVNYYSKVDNHRYYMSGKSGRKISVYDWSRLNGEFVRDYVRPQGLKHSMGFGFTDGKGRVRCIFSLDRTSFGRYTDKERTVMDVLHTHLDNLYVNMMLSVDKKDPDTKNPLYELLTPRERELAGLLCEGKAPAEIADILCISITTVYRHLTNMHAKLDVSSRQELILRLMNEMQ